MATISVTAEVTGSVWKIEKAVGDDLAEGDIIMILESMKMEIVVPAPEGGKLAVLDVAEGDSVEEEQQLCAIET